MSPAPNIRVIDSEASDHMNRNKSILSTLNSISSMIPVTLADGFTSYIKGVDTANATLSLSFYLFFIYLNSCLICHLLADLLNL